MIKKIRGSLAVKIGILTGALLLCVCLLVYGMLAWLMPRTYSGKLSDLLEEQAEDFITELEQVPFRDSGSLFDHFMEREDIASLELYSNTGQPVSYPTQRLEPVSVAQSSTVWETREAAPVLAGNFYFSFADSDERYTLVVYGTAGQVAELKQAFVQVFPLLLLSCIILASAVSWLYSRILTGPVLRISRISEKISRLQLEWQLEQTRTDELGILEKSLNTLARKLTETLADLKSANEKLAGDIEREKEMEQARLDFFSAASHELKTPITIIKGQLEGMLLGIGVYKDREKYLARSLEVAGTLETMVQEILTLSRLESSADCFVREPFDMVSSVRDCLMGMEDLIVQKDLQIHLRLPESAHMEGSRLLMDKVISNLIINAITYSPQGASIHIVMEGGSGSWSFSVENTGIHIPETTFGRLFDAFYRMEQSRNRKTGGSGLGLYIVKKALEQHGSSCQVCNTDAGVRFYFTV